MSFVGRSTLQTINSKRYRISRAQSSLTGINRVAGLYVSGANGGIGGALLASAGRDMNIVAGVISNAGTGTTALSAVNNLKLSTVKTEQSHNIVWDANNRRSDSQSADVGSQISGGGAVNLNAGQTLSATAANVQATGALNVNATDIQLQAGLATQNVDEAHQHTSKGFLNKSTITTRDTNSSTTALASNLGGATVNLNAGNDIALKGSNVVGDSNTTLMAKNNVTIEAAQNTSSSNSFNQTSQSGLMSGGGLGVSYGTRKQSVDGKDTTTTAAASTVGSVGGNVNITAGNQYKQVGSDVLAPSGDITIQAKKVDIVEARETNKQSTEQKFEQSGLTLSLSSPVLTAVQTAQAMGKAASQTSDDRMKMLSGASTALAASQAAAAVSAGQGDANGQLKNADGTMVDANAADKAGGISIAISLGSSKSSSQQTSQTDTAKGSSVNAGGNVNISATGGGSESNLTIQGSDLKAGNLSTLQADNQVNLQAAANTNTQTNSQNSSSASVGIGFSLGAQSNGFTLNASASKAQGNGNGSETTYSNTHVAANQVDIKSGGDTTLKGATVNASTVKAEVGGNLKIESLQDTAQYDEKSSSAGFGVSLCIPPFCVGASSATVNAGKTKIDSDYASVTEQSGIKAGGGGFTVNVGGNTDLKGGAITSTQVAINDNKNSFQTGGSLTTSDIQNKASYEATSVSVSVGTSMAATTPMSMNGVGVGNKSGSAASTTQAAISGVAGNTAARTGDKETGIAKIFNKDEVKADVQAQVAITSEFGKQASKAAGDYAETKLKEAKANNDQAGIDAWKEGGSNRVALHTVVGGLTGGAAGAVGAGAASAAAPSIDALQGQLQTALKDAGLGDAASKVIAGLAGGATAVTIGAAASGGSVAGAATAFNSDANNRQLHPNERQKAQDLAAKSGGKYTQAQIEDALRSAANSETGESIVAGMVVDPKERNAIFDKGAVWTKGEDGKLVQVIPPKPDPELANYIKQNTGNTYSWYSPSPSAATPSNAQRDKLTNLPLDDKGRYSQTVVLDGKAYEPKYLPCATTQCIAGGQNLDMTDPASQAYAKALDAQVFKDIGTGATTATLATPVGVAGRVLTGLGLAASTGSALTDSTLIDEALKNASQGGATKFFTEVLGHTPSAAARAVALIDLSGGWDAFVARLKADLIVSNSGANK